MRKLFLLFLLCPILLHAQDRKAAKAEEQRLAREMVDVIQEGGIIVRLATNARKIEGMREVLETGDLSTLNRARLKERIATTIEETRQQQELIVNTMRETYDLGPVYFIPDSTMTLLQQGAISGYFLDDNLQTDPNITRPDDFVVARIGYTDAATTSRAEALLLMDREQQTLPAPFPQAVTVNNLGYALNKLLAPDIAERRRIEGLVKRLQAKLSIAITSVLDEKE